MKGKKKTILTLSVICSFTKITIEFSIQSIHYLILPRRAGMRVCTSIQGSEM